MHPQLFTIHEVGEQLAPYVRRVLHAEAQIELVIRPAPTGYVYLGSIFNSGAIYVVDGEREIHSSTGWHFSGQLRNHNLRVRYHGHVGHLLAEFTPTGFYRLTGIRAQRLTNAAADVVTFSASLAKRLATVKLDAFSPVERVHIVEQCLVKLIPQARVEDHVVAQAARMLEESNGSARIDQIAAELEVSERTLCRRFQRIVGVTPKYFGQVRQINYAVEMLMADNVAALTAIAHRGGFYDQSHFIKAMHTFFEQGPQQFLNSRDPELATFLGKSRRVTAAAPSER